MLLYRSNPDTATLPYPVYVSPKLDGMRAVIHDGVVRTRTLKPLPNTFVQKYLGRQIFNGLDGELICGLPNEPGVLSRTTSLFRSNDEKLPTQWGFYVFDTQMTDVPYETRYKEAEYFVLNEKDPHIFMVPHQLVHNEKELLAYEQSMLNSGYEGIIIRCRGGVYSPSRTTLKQNNAFKLKRFTDTEAEIVGFFEEMENQNEASVDENLGNTKRSKKKEGLVGKGTLGGFLVKVPQFKEPQRVGSGFTKEQRKVFWDCRQDFIGATAKVKFFDHDIKDGARHMIFLDIRDMDLDG